MKPQQLKQLIREEIKNITKSLTEGKYDADLDKIEAAVKNASSFMNVGAELKKAGIKYDFSTSMIPMYTVKVSGNKIAIVNKKYAAGAEREVNNIAIGLLEGVNESVIKEYTKNFPGPGETVDAKDLDYDMLDYFSRTNKVLSIDTKSKKGIKGSVGKMYNDLVFNGDSIAKKDIVRVKILEGTYNNDREIAIGLLEGVNESVIKESTENFIGAALVKKSGLVKDLDSLEKEPIYVKDVLPIYRKEGSSYVVKSSLTSNALKVPAANLIVKMKDQFEPDKWAKFMAKVSRY
jgi:hypothetical protein